MFDDDFLHGFMFGSMISGRKKEEKKPDKENKCTYEQIHEILIKNFKAKKEIFEKFDRKDEISKCFYNIDQEIKKLFE